jgi:hypothetical protein
MKLGPLVVLLLLLTLSLTAQTQLTITGLLIPRNWNFELN